MGLLLYKSNEMFSATELIRKSKMIFDKIIMKEIDKAIILRDGKPSFLLMDFEKYENIMAEFETLKQQNKIPTETKKKRKEKKKESKIVLKSVQKDVSQVVEKNKITLKKVLPPIDTKEDRVLDTIQKEEPIETSKENDFIESPIELSEEEEVSNAFLTLENMNFSDEMKKEAQEKIKMKILQARKERAELFENQEQELQEETQEELEIKQHVEEEKIKKQRELKEFWD